MPETTPPTRTVRCIYTTVLSSKATRYFAVAPATPYEQMLATQLMNDVKAAVAANTNGGLCCSSVGEAASFFSASSSSSSDVSAEEPCVCLTNTTVVQVNPRFVDQMMLLGLTFEVHYAVYEYAKGRQLVSSSTAAAASAASNLAFVWSVDSHTAFRNTVKNFFHVLTRKDYLSELSNAPNVFAHVTVDELELMVHSDLNSLESVDYSSAYDAAASDMECVAAKVGRVGCDATLNRTSRMRLDSLFGTEVGSIKDYCTVLRGPLSAAYTYKPAAVKLKETLSNGTIITHIVPQVVVSTAQDYNDYGFPNCHGALCSLGTLCAVLGFILILAAGVTFVVQYCRRSRDEREDEKRLLQRQLQ